MGDDRNIYNYIGCENIGVEYNSVKVDVGWWKIKGITGTLFI